MDAENKLKRRQSTLDEATVQKLEKQINERPDKQELIDRNILKDDKGVAPSLIATREKLERSRLQDKLDQALQHRPNQNELIEQGILNADESVLAKED